MIVKKHHRDRKLILAVCDSELLGKKFEQDNKQLDLSSNFFKGKETSSDEFLQLSRRAYLINAVGEKSINLLLENDYISDKNIIKIGGVPSTQIFQGKF